MCMRYYLRKFNAQITVYFTCLHFARRDRSQLRMFLVDLLELLRGLLPSGDNLLAVLLKVCVHLSLYQGVGKVLQGPGPKCMHY